MKKLILLVCIAFSYSTQAQIISTIAGTGMYSYSGDGGAATNAKMRNPTQVAVDTAGNVYITDCLNQVVRKINTSGIISTIAGTGVAGFSGDGGAATLAKLNSPAGIFIDKVGNIFIGELQNNTVRKINTAGIISTVAGTGGVSGYFGDGGPATAARLNGVGDICFDTSGNLYLADYRNNVVRKVNTSGIISTIAGTSVAGYSGDGGPATAAHLNGPIGLCFDLSGNLLIADGTNSAIRKVNTSGQISTIAGTGANGYNGDGIAATAAQIYNPFGICIDLGGNIYIGDQGNQRIRRIDNSGIITTLAGTGAVGSTGDGGPATAAALNVPSGIFIHGATAYIADQWNNKIRMIADCDCPTGIAKVTDNAVNIFPNPAYSEVSVEVPLSYIAGTIQLINMEGMLLVERTITGNLNKVDISRLPTGTYIIKVQTSANSVYKEIIKN